MPQKGFQFGDARLPHIPDKHVLDLFAEGGSKVRVFNIVTTNV